VRGSERILELLEHQLNIKSGETTADGLFSLERAACFGCCALAPVAMVDKDVHGRISSVKAQKLLGRYNGKKG
jgi:NADH:ubiquinone oxidoreductase subunit E